MLLARSEFVGVIKNVMSGRGLAADAAMVVFPLEVFLPGSNVDPVVARKEEFYSALTRWTPAQAGGVAKRSTPMVSVSGATLEEAQTRADNLYIARQWGDGLPIVPPTAERVEAMLEYCDRPIDKPIAKMAPRYGEATPLRLAANAVMAGCEPRYFPLYMLAIEAMCDEPFNLYGVQATTHLCAPLVIVNEIGRAHV